MDKDFVPIMVKTMDVGDGDNCFVQASSTKTKNETRVLSTKNNKHKMEGEQEMSKGNTTRR